MSGAVIDHLWQSTLFCAAVWSITLALRSNHAALRHALWLAASIKFLVPFSALYQLGALAGSPSPVDTQPALLSQALDLAAPMVSPTHSLLAPAGRPSSWTSLLVAVWITGTLVLAVRWWFSWRAADSMARAARPAPGSPPDIRVVDASVEPATARVFRPVVLLPAALLGRLPAAQLDAIIAHERQHIARRDTFIAHLHRLVEVLFWFHPLVWWIGSRLVDERERACDEAVLREGHHPVTYAEGILAVCRQCRRSRSGATSALSGDLKGRISGIIAEARPLAPGFSKTIALSLFAVVVAGGPLLAGAVEDGQRRGERLARDMHAFRSARILISPTMEPAAAPRVLAHTRHSIVIRNMTLRELVALSYEVPPEHVEGGGDWLDAPRYDIRAELDDALSDPDDFEPAALRGAVLQLLASRFDLRVHVNQRCEAPCGRRALAAPPPST
jgi:bla regulator protein BlaR1